jgi:hypothetical protein
MTLTEYLSSQFPGHRVRTWQLVQGSKQPRGQIDLGQSVVAAQTVGEDAGLELYRRLRATADGGVVAADVLPVEPTVLPDAREDSEGVVDLPYRRVVVASAVGGLVAAVATGLVSLAVENAWSWPLAAWGLVLGAMVGAIFGSVRLVGRRAGTQVHAPGELLTVVTVECGSEREATDVVRRYLDEHGAGPDFRIINAAGAWHLPNV